MKKIEFVKSQFVSMVAHELKAPVAAVLGFINLILDPEIKTTDEQNHDYMNRSANRLQSLLAMVNDLLDISRMEIKTKQREIKDLDVNEILKTNIEFLELELQKRNITTKLELQPALPMLKADQNEINRLFTNIISNSVKYNKENGTINISTKLESNFISIKISDTGIGMKPEEKARLFSEFYRAKNENTRNIPGTGLGLSIVKRTVESYNGKIEVNSEYGKGTEFIVSFPLR